MHKYQAAGKQVVLTATDVTLIANYHNFNRTLQADGLSYYLEILRPYMVSSNQRYKAAYYCLMRIDFLQSYNKYTLTLYRFPCKFKNYT